MSAARLRLALACPTVGQTRRGYERFFTDLFETLAPSVDVTLFKGGGHAGPGEVVVPHLTRTGILERCFGHRLRYKRYRIEFATFAAALLPRLWRGRFDIVHFIDPPLSPYLQAIKRMLREPFELLFTDAGPVSFDASRFVDHIHCLTPARLALGRGWSIAPDRLTLLPVGVSLNTLSGDFDRMALRRQAGIAPETLVVLSVTSLNRYHKRVDYLIEEAAHVSGDMLLWIDGSPYPDGDPSLLDLARTRLGPRFRHTSVPSHRVGELYLMADVFVSSALDESFGMAAVEAACRGLPVVTHDSPHFIWLLDRAGTRLDLRNPGALAAWLREALAQPRLLERGRHQDEVAQRFGWPSVRAGYEQMYQGIIEHARESRGDKGTRLP